MGCNWWRVLHVLMDCALKSYNQENGVWCSGQYVDYALKLYFFGKFLYIYF